jgi:hypothetical protein
VTIGDFAAQPILTQNKTLKYRLRFTPGWEEGKSYFQEFIEETSTPGIFKISNDNNLPMFFKFEIPSVSEIEAISGFTIETRLSTNQE